MTLFTTIDQLRIGAVTIGLYVGVSLALPTLTLPVSGSFAILVDPATALLVPLALLLGPVAAYGVGLGFLISEAAVGALWFESIFWALAQFYIAYSACTLWKRSGSRAFSLLKGNEQVQLIPKYLGISGVSTAGGVAIIAWGNEVAGVSPFHLTVVLEGLGLLVGTVFIGLPLFLLGYRVLGGTARPERRPPTETVNRRRLTYSAIVIIFWTVVGGIGSLGYRSLEQIPEYVFVRRFEFLHPVTQPSFGTGAASLQVLFGAVMFGFLFGMILPRGSSESSSETDDPVYS
jgi:hypothetical protein